MLFRSVLEDRKVRRIGSSVDIPVDVRIIAATNQDINKLLESGRFRTDLYYRLNSFEIKIPPLRERKDDIPILLDYYVKLLSQRLGKRINGIDPAISRIMMSYSFPGNVRELRNMVERAIILCDGNKLTLKNFTGLTPSSEQTSPTSTIGEEIFDLDLIEKIVIMKALEKTGYKKAETAQMLNITRQSLDRRLEKYEINI